MASVLFALLSFTTAACKKDRHTILNVAQEHAAQMMQMDVSNGLIQVG